MSSTADKTRESNNDKGIREGEIEAELCKARLELLYDVAQKATTYQEVANIIEHILFASQRILKASASSLLLVDEEKGELYVHSARGKAAKKIKQMKIDLDSGIAGWVARKGLAVTANDVSRDKRFNKDIDEITNFQTKSIIAVPLLRGEKVIGVLELLNKVDGEPFNEQDLTVLTGFASTEALILLVSMVATAINNIKLQKALLDAYKGTVESLATAADAKDPYAHGHSRRVRDYTLLAADSLSLSPEELGIIEFGALLHDIGKLGIDDNILRRTGPLTFEERYIMRKHSVKGANIVDAIPFLEKARPIILYHHEWYNGTGYPEGLKGEDIPIGARLVAVADAFDTMTTEHSYRTAMSVDEAINALTKGISTQFCPLAAQAFVSALKEENLIKKAADLVAKETRS